MLNWKINQSRLEQILVYIHFHLAFQTSESVTRPSHYRIEFPLKQRLHFHLIQHGSSRESLTFSWPTLWHSMPMKPESFNCLSLPCRCVVFPCPVVTRSPRANPQCTFNWQSSSKSAFCEHFSPSFVHKWNTYPSRPSSGGIYEFNRRLGPNEKIKCFSLAAFMDSSCRSMPSSSLL